MVLFLMARNGPIRPIVAEKNILITFLGYKVMVQGLYTLKEKICLSHEK
ncbi:MAG: hypothetical protein K6T99_10465 [Armatimonadetes bacterium]|nr:hypothetical protein [Armatimonadota bacterium]